MTSPKEFLTLPAAPPARARAAGGVRRPLPADQGARPSSTTSRSIEWLERASAGADVVEKLWKPLLDSKFDGRFDDLPATYIWARTRRMGGDARQERPRGHGLARGRLPDAHRRARARGSSPWAARYTQGRPSSRSPPKAAAPSASWSTVASSAFDHVLCTLAPPMARRLLAPELAEQAPADHCRYLGVVCLLLRVTAERQPVLPPEHHRPARPADDGRRDDARGRPGACRRAPALRLEVRRPGPPGPRAPAGGARAEVPGATRARSSPTCATTRSSRSVVQRARVTEPVHLVGGAKRLPEMFSGAGPLARVDRARLPGDRQRPGRDRRRRHGRARDPRAASGERTAGGGMTRERRRRSARASTRRLRVASRGRRSRVARLARCSRPCSRLTWGTWGDLDSDTGYDVVAANRVAQTARSRTSTSSYYYGPLAPAPRRPGDLARRRGRHAPSRRSASLLDGGDRRSPPTRSRARSSGRSAPFLAAAITDAVAFIPNNYSASSCRTPCAATLGMLRARSGCCSASRQRPRKGTTAWLVGVGALLGLAALTKPESALAALSPP